MYTFAELSESAQEHALDRLWDINVDGEWWESMEIDIAQFGKMSGLGCLYGGEFDLDRRDYLYIKNIGCHFNELLFTASQVQRDYPDAYTAILHPFLKLFSPRERKNLLRMERLGILNELSGNTTMPRTSSAF